MLISKEKPLVILGDPRIPNCYKKQLCMHYSCEWLDMPLLENVYASISGHPDIQLFQIDDHSLIYSPHLDEEFIAQVCSLSIEMIQGDQAPQGSYPLTTPYNVLKIGRLLFHNPKYTDRIIVSEAKQRGFTFVPIKQGYARCSSCVVNEQAMITADRGVAKAARKHKIDVLLIQSEGIALSGQEYGFIGGCSGGSVDGEIVFLGDIGRHPNEEQIQAFLIKHGVRFFTITNKPLIDCGTLIFLEG